MVTVIIVLNRGVSQNHHSHLPFLFLVHHAMGLCFRTLLIFFCFIFYILNGMELDLVRVDFGHALIC